MSTYHGVNTLLAKCLNSVLNVKALVGAFSVIVQLHRLIVYSTTRRGGWAAVLQCQAWDGEWWGEDEGGFIYLVRVGLDVR